MSNGNSYASIDDHLGPRSSRFFGAGFKRVSRQVRAAVVDRNSGTLTARVGLRYPADWSTKSTARTLVPHLSTIDAGVLSVVLGESYLTSVLALSAAQRRRMWLRRLVIKAGTRPQEQLADFEVSARHLEARAEPFGVLSVLECRLGAMRTRCEIVHEPGQPGPDDGPTELPDDLLGDPEHRYYGTGFQSRHQDIHGVRLDPDGSNVSATVHITPDGWYPNGFEGDYQPSVSVIDGMIVLAQLAQSLLYRLDGIDRSESNTLWMREVVVSTDTAIRPLTGPFHSATTITRSRLLPFDGGRWRTSDWTADFSGLRFDYRLAHRLPETGAGPAAVGIR